MIVLGIDPGGRTSALVVRDGTDLLWHRLVDSGGAPGLPSADYLHEVQEAAQEARGTFGPLRYALEAVTPPTGFHRGARDPIQPGSLIAVSAVAGFLLGSLPDVVLVPPAGNGSRPLSTYPAALVGDREKRGTGILRHARSAWDVAGHPNVRRAT